MLSRFNFMGIVVKMPRVFQYISQWLKLSVGRSVVDRSIYQLQDLAA